MAGRFTVEAVFKAVDQFAEPVRRMQKTVGKFTRSAERGLRKVNGAVNAVGAALKKGLAVGITAATAAMAGFSAALLKTAASADSLAKESRRIDFPIKDLQEWRFVAEQSGFSVDEFSKATEQMSKRIGEARANTGSLSTFLKKSDPLLLRQVTRAGSTAEAMELLVAALQNSKDAAERAALANAAFGRQGLKMSNIAELGALKIAELRKEQRENGLITQQQAEAAEQFNDALNSLKRAGLGFIQSVLLPLMPLLTDLIRDLRLWAVANRELISGKVLDFFNFLINDFDSILERIASFGKAIAIFVAFVAVLKTLIGVLTLVNLLMTLNPIGLIVIGVAAAIAAITALVMWLDKVIEKFDLVGKGTKFFKDLFGIDDADAQQQAARERRNDVTSADGPRVVSREERVAREIEEQRSTSTAELVIKDESGRAEVQGDIGPGIGVQLQPTGAF